jgi:prepilin-type N-terminal cleavage/methylation domain-containing protein
MDMKNNKSTNHLTSTQHMAYSIKRIAGFTPTTKKLVWGFTLIELLVVISLIAVLTTLIAANLNAARERGRDAARKSDIRNIQTALRLYYNDKGIFPANTTNYNIAGCTDGTQACSWGSIWSIGSVIYMSVLPKDPISTMSYGYQQTDDGEGYTLDACLENQSDDKCQIITGVCSGQCTYRVQP